MFDFLKKKTPKINVTERIDAIEAKVYAELKPLGFRKHGRTLHRFVDGDISQVINFQCGQAYREETHLMWVNIGIRVPECFLRSFSADEPRKKYYRECECTIRSCLGTIKKSKVTTYNLRKNNDKITEDILYQINKYVLPAFEVLNSREAILRERRNYPHFDTRYDRVILLEEAMIYGKMGDMENAITVFNQYYNGCIKRRKPNKSHIEYLRKLANELGIPLDIQGGKK